MLISRLVTRLQDLWVLVSVLYRVLVKEPAFGTDLDSRQNQITYLDSYLAACKCGRCQSIR